MLVVSRSYWLMTAGVEEGREGGMLILGWIDPCRVPAACPSLWSISTWADWPRRAAPSTIHGGEARRRGCWSNEGTVGGGVCGGVVGGAVRSRLEGVG
jgi:hypothetical protein